ncbi:MAG: general secretion pathway protein GspK [Planctomycetes bacterium]|nr:general secretion pathway protein GspK [Planctomycetota bacterium]
MKSNRGFVLIVAIGAILFLTLVIYTFTVFVATNRAVAENQVRELTVFAAAKGNIEIAVARLKDSRASGSGVTWDSLLQDWATPFYLRSNAGQEIVTGTADEERKINLLYLSESYRDSDIPVDRRRYYTVKFALIKLVRLMRGVDRKDVNHAYGTHPSFHISETELVNRLEDWINKENLSTTIISLQSPLPMVSLKELEYIGFEETLLYGFDPPESVKLARSLIDDALRQRSVETLRRLKPSESVPWLVMPFVEFVTINPSMKTNVNTAQPFVVATLLFGAMMANAQLENENKDVDPGDADVDFDIFFDEYFDAVMVRESRSGGAPGIPPLASMTPEVFIFRDQLTKNEIDKARAERQADAENSFRSIEDESHGFMAEFSSREDGNKLRELVKALAGAEMLTTSSNYFLVESARRKDLQGLASVVTKIDSSSVVARALFKRIGAADFRLVTVDAY